MSAQHKRSLAFGALIGPLVVPLCILPIMIAGELSTVDPTGPHLAAIFVSLLVFALPFTYAVTLTLVVPAALWLRRKQALSAVGLCAWSTLIGPVTALAYLQLLAGNVRNVEPATYLIWAGFGLVSGIAFCLASGIPLMARKAGASCDSKIGFTTDRE